MQLPTTGHVHFLVDDFCSLLAYTTHIRWVVIKWLEGHLFLKRKPVVGVW